MAEQVTTINRIEIALNAKGPGKHWVEQRGTKQWMDGELPLGTPEHFVEPFARDNLADLLSNDLGFNVEGIATLTADLDAKDAELTTAVAALATLQASVTAKDAEIATLKAEIDTLKAPPVIEIMHAAAFWTAAEIKLGITQEFAFAAVEQMPEATEDEQAAKILARNVVKTQSKFQKNNPLLAQLVAIANAKLGSAITPELFDEAWAYGMARSWG
jgi:hypothetical protein